MDENLKNLFGTLDELLSSTNLDDVTADGVGYKELPDGYYLSELTKAELTESKSSHQPMIAIQFTTVENGLGVNLREDESSEFVEISKTKNQRISMYYVLKDEASVKRFVTDMLKFEGDVEGEPLLTKDYFLTSELLEDALDVLTGSRIYVQISTTVRDDDTTSTWRNLISWKRAKALDLPL